MTALSMMDPSAQRNPERVGAENTVTSCDLHVLVYETAESISAQGLECSTGRWGSGACGRLLMQRSVWAVGVVVLDELVQHLRQVAWSGDQRVVEAFAAQSADEALGDRVCARCPDWGADDGDVGAGEHGVECGGELGVSVTDQEPELLGAVAEVHQQVAGLPGDPGASGLGRD